MWLRSPLARGAGGGHHHVKLPARLEGRSPGATQGELLVERALAHVRLAIIQQRRRRELELSQEHHNYATAWQDRDSASIQYGGKRYEATPLC